MITFILTTSQNQEVRRLYRLGNHRYLVTPDPFLDGRFEIDDDPSAFAGTDFDEMRRYFIEAKSKVEGQPEDLQHIDDLLEMVDEAVNISGVIATNPYYTPPEYWDKDESFWEKWR